MLFNSDLPERREIIDINTDMCNTDTWPVPPVTGQLTESPPSRRKPMSRDEKSLFDLKGGEWRPHKPDQYHPVGHWNYKGTPKSQWKNIDVYGNVIEAD